MACRLRTRGVSVADIAYLKEDCAMLRGMEHSFMKELCHLMNVKSAAPCTVEIVAGLSPLIPGSFFSNVTITVHHSSVSIGHPRKVYQAPNPSIAGEVGAQIVFGDLGERLLKCANVISWHQDDDASEAYVYFGVADPDANSSNAATHGEKDADYEMPPLGDLGAHLERITISNAGGDAEMSDIELTLQDMAAALKRTSMTYANEAAKAEPEKLWEIEDAEAAIKKAMRAVRTMEPKKERG
jgi:hypothetical protein